MREAIRLARRGTGVTSPNPPVGAVIVRDGAIIGRGWHRGAGHPHAEIEAMRDASRRGHDPLAGCTMYVTLEPCSSHGRTPPCVEAVMAAGFRRVVWGTDDPDPRHSGRAAAILQGAGIEIATGIAEDECRELIRPFAKRVRTGLPWVIAKAGMTLDGRITRPGGEGRWITGEAARADAMKLRARCDAIVAGAGTIRADDPALTVRGPGFPRSRRQPLRIILSNSGDLPASARVLTDEHRDRTRIFQGLTLRDALLRLAADGVNAVLLEGGGSLLAQAFADRLVDEVVFYCAPLISGSGRPAVDAAWFSGGSVALEFRDVRRVGSDLRIHAFPVSDP